MARIQYIAYSLNDPDRCLEKDQYDFVSRLPEVEFSVFLNQAVSQSWGTYKQDNKHLFRPALGLVIAAVLLGIVTSFLDSTGKKSLTEIVGFGFLISVVALLGVGASLAMSAASHSHYTRQLKSYLIRQRQAALRSGSYQEYLKSK